MSSETTTTPVARRTNLIPLWAMMLIFGVPFLASVMLFLNPDWLSTATGNRGTLINPPVDTRGWRFTTDTGEAYDPAEPEDSWIILLIADGVCSSRCEERAYELRQVRRATGVERARVARLMVFLEPPTEATKRALNEYYPRLPRIIVDQKHPLHDLPGEPLTVGSVVIVDPMRQAMMRYAATQPAKDILKDLKHLLKVSEDWTKDRQQ